MSTRPVSETAAAPMLHRFTFLEDCTIGATDGDIGKVHDLFFDDRSWTVRYVVADTSAWLPSHRVLISPVAVRGIDATDLRVLTSLSKAEVEGSPRVDTAKPVSWRPSSDSCPGLLMQGVQVKTNAGKEVEAMVRASALAVSLALVVTGAVGVSPALAIDPATQAEKSYDPVGAMKARYPQEEVREVQRMLQHRGYDPGPVDGRLTEKTQEALAKFQRDNGFVGTGTVTAETLAKLREAS